MSTSPGGVSQADFFCGKLNGITFPYSSGGIHFRAFFLKLPGMKNSMIFAINHPTCKNKTEAKKFWLLTNLYRCHGCAAPRSRDVIAALMRTINNSNWTQYQPDTKVFRAVAYRNSASAKRQFRHPVRTVVINNPAANVEEFRLRPIEWSVG